MTKQALLENEFSLPATDSPELTRISSTASPAPASGERGRLASVLVLRFLEDDPPLPAGFTPVDKIVAELEQDPAFRSRMEEGRRWVAETFYSHERGSLKSLRLAKGWSQSRLAEEIGTSQPHIARIESGSEDIRLSTLRRLAASLDIRVAQVVDAIPNVTLDGRTEKQ
jgi:DNA-binding Xre family transcriptional regulator